MLDLVKHGAELLDQPRETGLLLRLLFGNDEAAARSDDHIIVAIGEHCAPIDAGRDQVPRS